MPRYCTECGHELIAKQLEGRSRLACGECGWVYWEDPKVVVAVIVCRSGEVLLGRRGYGDAEGRWTFPAGFVDRGERLEDAAVRETREETGLTVTLGPLFTVHSETDDPVVLVVFPAEIVGGEPAPGDELSELGWFGRGQTPEMAFAHDREILDMWWCSQEGNE